jgi:GT2 family glycosyltransferase
VLRAAIIIPTYKRPGLANVVLAALERQTLQPHVVFIAAPDESHVVPYQGGVLDVRMVYGTLGSSAQRNAALELALLDSDLVFFFDDDFIPDDRYLEEMAIGFRDHPTWMGAMGRVLKDGARGESVTAEEARALLDAPVPASEPTIIDEHTGTYGCNMVARTAAVGSIRFDERLVLYGWQEDIDFSHQLLRQGVVVYYNRARGVHLGVKGGRTSGLRMGYSQIVNPIYLVRKGTMPRLFALNLMTRNLLANALKSLKPEPWIDRWGRLRGNLLALSHVLRGRIEPEYILKL